MIKNVKPQVFFTCGLSLLICVGSTLIGFDQIRLKNKELDFEKHRSTAMRAEIARLRMQTGELKQVVKGWNDLVLEIVEKEESDRERISSLLNKNSSWPDSIKGIKKPAVNDH